MIVYRIERPHIDGVGNTADGPYTGSAIDAEVKHALGAAHGSDKAEHPSPALDGIGRPYGFEVCGFESISKAGEWFAGWFEFLHRAGFVLSAYRIDADAVRLGVRQLVFDAHAAERIRTVPLCLKAFQRRDAEAWDGQECGLFSSTYLYAHP